MANTLTAIKGDVSRRRRLRRFKLTVTGSYVNGTGEVLNFTAVSNPSFLESPAPGWFPAPSIDDFVIEKMPQGYTGEIVANGANTAASNAFALKFFSSAGTELASGAYSAGVLADYAIIAVKTSTFAG